MHKNIPQGSSERTYPLTQIYFYLTDGCNLRCRHCWISPKYSKEGKFNYIPVSLFRSIIEEAKPLGLQRVKLTGGEPLLHPDIQEIINIIRDNGLILCIETNGVLCTLEMVRLIASCKPGCISVSLDGANKETHEWVRGVEGCFDAALEGIRNLVNAGIKPEIIMTIMRRNSGQIEDMIRLAESLGASSLKFNVVQPTARGEKMHDAGETSGIEELVSLGKWVEGELAEKTFLKLHYTQPPAFRPMGKMFGSTGCGCTVCGILNIVGVLADGTYALCGIGAHVPELTFGKAGKDRLEDVWSNEPILRELREGLPARLEGVCGECLMKSICLGSCIAQNYYSSKSIWAPFWYCKEAKNRDIFPASRIYVKPDK
ncbi:SynChlorMet cassette radical SAM/SPASM protein ScmF [Methanocella sp. CWC-04]|uniref:SynChlorMet cassette radical SAM/SPASM protein ScmF n=1 Tax=Methanooceanicella nereidis TaxID=2052831 RepID=A0AAP2W760_9EURY|nr:SynChlorMet cassette radical SAM/SPASM protein ScmF [Methanocella sp. CWC-04]MCD1294899.1 SynChlorMet cassette radical SAM/SPASM protein ScmF [Methanocella sp. CWC-04]